MPVMPPRKEIIASGRLPALPPHKSAVSLGELSMLHCLMSKVGSIQNDAPRDGRQIPRIEDATRTLRM